MARYRRSLAAGAIYFFTVNLADRDSDLLVTQIDRLRRTFDTARSRHPFHMLAYCALPDHLHAIWRLPENDHDFSLRWNVIKRTFSSGLAAADSRTPSKMAKREKGLWQRRFWEHQIRDDKDFERHVDYIHINPVKHGHVARVVDWPHSSFHTFVERGVLTTDWAGVVIDDNTVFGERTT